MIILAHPTGNAFVRNALEAFDAHGGVEFFTTVAIPQGVAKNFPVARATVARRTYPIDWKHIHLHPWRELARLFLKPAPAWSVDAVYESLDKQVAAALPKLLKAKNASAVYAYEDGAYHTFAAAHGLGMRTLYDLPIGHYAAAQNLFKEEASRKPEWASTLTGLTDTPEKLARKATELASADTIIVASSFTASTIAGLVRPDQKVALVPYGTTPGLPFPTRKITQRLKVLYVGSLTQRKGISYLFDAVAALGDAVELTVVGRPAAPCAALQKALVGHHHYESLPHPEVLRQMREHDVLVFPSLFEGFGLVLTEALSCGLPIIATPNTAAPDIITDGVEGFIVPIRDTAAITEKLRWAATHRRDLAAMQQAAWARAQVLGWPHYQTKLLATLPETV